MGKVMDEEQLIFKAIYDSLIAKGTSPYRIAFDLYLDARAAKDESAQRVAALEAEIRELRRAPPLAADPTAKLG